MNTDAGKCLLASSPKNFFSNNQRRYKEHSVTSASPRFSTLEHWLSWLETIHPCEIDLGLTRIRIVADRMGIGTKPSNGAPLVTVAGTNGKGSFVASMQQLLSTSDKHVGTYTSPHILKYNERIQIDGISVTDSEICNAFVAIDRARLDGDSISLTYFEFSTLAALKIFDDKNLDVWVLEVGLGGRLDAVNIMDADVAVVTSIAVDHEKWLGNTRELIAIEKAGIIREAAYVVCADFNPPHTLIEKIDDKTDKSYFISRDFDFRADHLNTSEKDFRSTYRLSVDNIDLSFDKRPNLPLPSIAAAVQVYCLLNRFFNLACFKTDTFKSVNLIKEHFSNIIPNLCLAGRFEYMTINGVNVILDVAHNPAAAEHLALRLKETLQQDITIINRMFSCLCAMMEDKDNEAVFAHIMPFVEGMFCSEIPDFHRSAGYMDLKKSVENVIEENRLPLVSSALEKPSQNVHAIQNFEEALLEGLEHAKKNKQWLLIFGSFYTVALAKQLFSEKLATKQ